MLIPMRPKYIDEAVGIWFIFGTNPENGGVDISDGNNDVFTDIPYEIALKLVEVQNEFRNKLYSILCNLGEKGK